MDAFMKRSTLFTMSQMYLFRLKCYFFTEEKVFPSYKVIFINKLLIFTKKLRCEIRGGCVMTTCTLHARAHRIVEPVFVVSNPCMSRRRNRARRIVGSVHIAS